MQGRGAGPALATCAGAAGERSGLGARGASGRTAGTPSATGAEARTSTSAPAARGKSTLSNARRNPRACLGRGLGAGGSTPGAGSWPCLRIPRMRTLGRRPANLGSRIETGSETPTVGASPCSTAAAAPGVTDTSPPMTADGAKPANAKAPAPGATMAF